MESKRPAPAARSEPGRRAIASGPAPAPALRADGPVLNRRGPVDRRLIRIIQRTAGNLAAGSLVVEREPAPTFEQGRARATGPITFEWGGGRGSQAPAIPTAPSDPAGRTAPELTPGGYKAAAALALADGVRKHLDRVALEAERSAALSALLAKEPAIYDTLHTSPGKGLIVNLNFKSTDPETLKGRPPDLKVPLQLKFVGVSVSAPFELPEPSTGPAIGPGASGPGFVGYGWKGRTLTVTVQPVRPDPGKDPKKAQIIESAEALMAYLVGYAIPLPLLAGQLRNGQKQDFINLDTGAPPVPVVAVNLGGAQLLVLEGVATAVSGALAELARTEIRRRSEAARTSMSKLQRRLSRAVREGGVSRWWSDRAFRIDPHLLDSPRAHLAAATNYLGSDDLSNAWLSLTACEDTLGLARNLLYAYETGDLSDPARQSPTGVSTI